MQYVNKQTKKKFRRKIFLQKMACLKKSQYFKLDGTISIINESFGRKIISRFKKLKETGKKMISQFQKQNNKSDDIFDLLGRR